MSKAAPKSDNLSFLRNPTELNKAFQEAVDLINAEFTRNISVYKEMIHMFTDDPDFAEDILQEIFAQALEAPDLFDEKRIQDQIASLIHDKVERERETVLQTVHDITDPLEPTVQEMAQSLLIKKYVRQAIGEDAGLTAKEMLAVLSQISTSAKTGNILVREDVGPEDLEKGLEKISQVPKLQQISKEL